MAVWMTRNGDFFFDGLGLSAVGAFHPYIHSHEWEEARNTLLFFRSEFIWGQGANVKHDDDDDDGWTRRARVTVR